MSTPSPISSFLGGLGLPFATHALTLLNGSVFGISGFLHRAARGNKEAMAGVAGLIIGGLVVGLTEGAGPRVFPMSYLRIILSGLLVGVGTKMGNGCTSGHMICGISRLSVRSITATAVFFSTGVIGARFSPESVLVPSQPFDWSLGPTGTTLLALQIIPFTVSVLLYILAPRQPTDKSQPALPIPRLIASLATSLEFAFALRLSNLTEPIKVLTFLLLPFNAAFDPSLSFLAVGALPLAIVLYQFARGPEQPRLGGTWSVPKGGKVDLRLIIGAALFGIGWGSGGICPGPALVNLGRAISGGSDPLPMITWLSAVLLGGAVAEL
ncbi:hypothetical protein FB45DRAFT_913322 [Roridomyces roridus]|uniref:Sulphur transport domain-containing protein n=1 Tax=Roridomyces roridus TaxID=1738132 RepID=A0AAD7BWZ1_9AGAR|nr:hypothetical protein FB45DRAFT_913322 [Roridomyces roridus]